MSEEDALYIENLEDERERLEVENKNLREALEEYLKMSRDYFSFDEGKIALKALNKNI